MEENKVYEKSIEKAINEDEKNKILALGVRDLPLNPASRGYSASEIKKRFYEPEAKILDALDKLESDVIEEFDNVGEAIDKVNKSKIYGEDNILTGKNPPIYPMINGGHNSIENSGTLGGSLIIGNNNYINGNARDIGLIGYGLRNANGSGFQFHVGRMNRVESQILSEQPEFTPDDQSQLVFSIGNGNRNGKFFLNATDKTKGYSVTITAATAEEIEAQIRNNIYSGFFQANKDAIVNPCWDNYCFLYSGAEGTYNEDNKGTYCLLLNDVGGVIEENGKFYWVYDKTIYDSVLTSSMQKVELIIGNTYYAGRLIRSGRSNAFYVTKDGRAKLLRQSITGLTDSDLLTKLEIEEKDADILTSAKLDATTKVNNLSSSIANGYVKNLTWEAVYTRKLKDGVLINGGTALINTDSFLTTSQNRVSGIPLYKDGYLYTREPRVDLQAANKLYVDKIAAGHLKGVVFSSVSNVVSFINSYDNKKFIVGQPIYIIPLDFPDLWVSAVEDTSQPYTWVSNDELYANLKTNGSVRIGYYELSMLETQKVDLTEYAEKNYVDDKFVAKSDVTYKALYGRYNSQDTTIPMANATSDATINLNGCVPSYVYTSNGNHLRVNTPTIDVDVANKKYVDDKIAEVNIGSGGSGGTKLYKHTRSISFVPIDTDNWGDYFECTISCITNSTNNVIVIAGAVEGEGIPPDEAIEILGAYIQYDGGINQNILQPVFIDGFGGGARSLSMYDEWDWMPSVGYEATEDAKSWLRTAMQESGGLTYYTINDENVVEL